MFNRCIWYGTLLLQYDQLPESKKKKTSTNIGANSGIEMVSSGSHWPSEVVDISAANQNQGGLFSRGISRLARKRRVLQRAVCYLATRIDNNRDLQESTRADGDMVISYIGIL